MSGLMALTMVSAAGSTLSPAVAGPENHKGPRYLDIRLFSFVPNLIRVTPGRRIYVTNYDGITHGVPHTVTSNDGLFDTGPFWKVHVIQAPTTPGRYPYHCAIHPFMRGVIAVIDGS